jgi:AcrR family transcriptional regulator
MPAASRPLPIPGRQTRGEILDHALRIMADDGVAGLTMARLARAMDIRPPSLYKYYPSLLAVYDALFRRGQLANLEALREGMRGATPGLDTVAGAMEATGRWAVANPILAQLLFWRPVPGYQPSAAATGTSSPCSSRPTRPGHDRQPQHGLFFRANGAAVAARSRPTRRALRGRSAHRRSA